MTIAAMRLRLDAVQASYDRTKALATSLMHEYPPLSADSLLDIARSIAGLAQGGYARLGAAEYAGLVRLALAAATGNISRARALVQAGSTREDLILLLLGKAAATIAALNAMAAGLKSTEQAIAEGIRAVGLAGTGMRGLGVVGWDDIAVLLIVVVSVALLYSLLSSVQASYSANEAADSACARDAAAGRPCTGTQWTQYRDDALAASSAFSLVPNLGRALERAGSGIALGLGVGILGLFAYGAWVAAPAAQITRDRLRARAAR